MATLTVTQTTDFRGDPPETDIDALVFADPNNNRVTVTFEPAQFGDGLISPALAVTGGMAHNHIRILAPDVLTGFYGMDLTLEGWTFTDWSAADRITLVGTSFRDHITGSSQRDLISGGPGNDRLEGGAGDTLIGGDGNDYYVNTGGLASIEETHQGGYDSVEVYLVAGQSYILPDHVERLLVSGRGTAVGNALDNEFVTLRYTDDAILVGGAGNDTYRIGDDWVLIEEAAGAAGGIDHVIAEDSANLSEYRNVEHLTVRGGYVRADGNSLDNRIIIEATERGSASGRDGDDTIQALGDAPATLGGGAGHDELEGGDGADKLTGGGGADIMTGGLGNDTYVDVDAADFIVEFSGGGTDTVFSKRDMTLAAFVENLVLTGTGRVSGEGNDEANSIAGNAVANLLKGWAGDDTIDGGNGIDTIRGGDGDDVASGGAGADLIMGEDGNDYLTGGGGNDTLRGNDGDDRLAGRHEGKDILYGDAGNDTMDGLQADTLYGGDGNDSLAGYGSVLEGGIGDDTLSGGNRATTLAGGDGDDTYMGYGIIVEAEGLTGGFDTYVSDRWFSIIPEAIERLVLSGVSDLSATGSVRNDVIEGNAGANRINGRDGNDTLSGGDGNDTLIGGVGADSMTGGAGDDTYVDVVLTGPRADTVIEASGGGIDALETARSVSLAGLNIENVTLTGSAASSVSGDASAKQITGNGAANTLDGLGDNDTITGGYGSDTISGGGGNDLLAGEAGNDLVQAGNGNDTITGGAGHDTMDGGGGRDVFRFLEADTGADRIENFDEAVDRFVLTGNSFTGMDESGGDTTLFHEGGSILITGITGYSIIDWNALVLDETARSLSYAANPAFLSLRGADSYADYLA